MRPTVSRLDVLEALDHSLNVVEVRIGGFSTTVMESNIASPLELPKSPEPVAYCRRSLQKPQVTCS